MVDALASGASIRKDVEVRVLSWAPVIPAIALNNNEITKSISFLLPDFRSLPLGLRRHSFEACNIG
jgi:hypothetical protein